eukprot:scpid58367/ scgid11830/ 
MKGDICIGLLMLLLVVLMISPCRSDKAYGPCSGDDEFVMDSNKGSKPQCLCHYGYRRNAMGKCQPLVQFLIDASSQSLWLAPRRSTIFSYSFASTYSHWIGELLIDNDVVTNGTFLNASNSGPLAVAARGVAVVLLDSPFTPDDDDIIARTYRNQWHLLRQIRSNSSNNSTLIELTYLQEDSTASESFSRRLQYRVFSTHCYSAESGDNPECKYKPFTSTMAYLGWGEYEMVTYCSRTEGGAMEDFGYSIPFPVTIKPVEEHVPAEPATASTYPIINTSGDGNGHAPVKGNGKRKVIVGVSTAMAIVGALAFAALAYCLDKRRKMPLKYFISREPSVLQENQFEMTVRNSITSTDLSQPEFQTGASVTREVNWTYLKYVNYKTEDQTDDCGDQGRTQSLATTGPLAVPPSSPISILNWDAVSVSTLDSVQRAMSANRSWTCTPEPASCLEA